MRAVTVHRLLERLWYSPDSIAAVCTRVLGNSASADRLSARSFGPFRVLEDLESIRW